MTKNAQNKIAGYDGGWDEPKDCTLEEYNEWKRVVEEYNWGIDWKELQVANVNNGWDSWNYERPIVGDTFADLFVDIGWDDCSKPITLKNN